jgi:serine/threonine-protein kinase
VCGHFEIVRAIGRGGMGEVFAARNTRTGRSVALKIIRTNDDELPDERRRRFKREARAATAIGHANVVEVFDVLEDGNGAPVMVMELLEGESLAEMLARERKLPLGAAAAALAPVASALQAAHDKGIVHRDLKPDNVFLSQSGDQVVPKVLDFGIAKVLDPGSIGGETQGGLPTATSALLGTPHYMSYEQAMSEKDIDARSDVWSFGVILFEALAGRRPLLFDNLGEMYTQLLSAEVPRVAEHVPELPPGLAALIDQALVKDKGQRLADLGPLVAELERHADAAELALCTRRSRKSSSGAVPTQDAFSATRPAGSARPPALSRWWLAAGGVGVVGAAAIALATGSGSVAGKAQFSQLAASAGERLSTPTAAAGTAVGVEPASLPAPTPPAGPSGQVKAQVQPPRQVQPAQPPAPEPSAAPPPPPPTGIIEDSPYKRGKGAQGGGG